jgi:hypothetical protein
MKHYLVIIFILVGLTSCDKEDSDNLNNDNQYPQQVDFIYQGETVSYGVIKKSYTIGSDGNTLSTPITKLWLDRNLGSFRPGINKNDSLAAGDLFQWGRQDDGHQNRYSDTTHILSESISPGHDKFIARPLNSDDWLTESNDLLWNGDQNTNCPCPDGWRVPTEDELAMEMNSWTPNDLDGAFASELKWVSAGSRSNHGTLRYSEYWAFIWSSTPLEYSRASRLVITGSESELIESNRIYGGTVRCIKDF